MGLENRAGALELLPILGIALESLRLDLGVLCQSTLNAGVELWAG